MIGDVFIFPDASDENDVPQDLSMKRCLKPVSSMSLTPGNNRRLPLAVLLSQPSGASPETGNRKACIDSMPVFKRVPLKVVSVAVHPHLVARSVPLQGSSTPLARSSTGTTGSPTQFAASTVLRPVARHATLEPRGQPAHDTALDLSKSSMLTAYYKPMVKQEHIERNVSRDFSAGASPEFPQKNISAKISVPIKLEQTTSTATQLYPRKIVTSLDGTIKMYTSEPTATVKSFAPTIVSRPAFPGLPMPPSSRSATLPLSISNNTKQGSVPTAAVVTQKLTKTSFSTRPHLHNWSNMCRQLSRTNADINAYQGLQLISEVASRVNPTQTSPSSRPAMRHIPSTPRSPLRNLLNDSWRPPVYQSSVHQRGGSLSPPGSDGSSSASSETSPPNSQRASCTQCGRRYATIAGLNRHQQQCTPGKCYSCPTCGKTYTSCGALKMHIRTHTLPCKCHVCGKAFSRPWLLQGHIRTHTGEKPFQCSDCHRSFADRSNLRAHQQTHATVKKYACPVCTKTFSRMSLLNKHEMQGCHPLQSIGTFTVAPQLASPV